MLSTSPHPNSRAAYTPRAARSAHFPAVASSSARSDGPPPHSPASSAASPRSVTTSAKPRLLWKSSLVLQDGTLLPGVAFASHIDPFRRRANATSLTGGTLNVDAGQDVLKSQLEAEEGLCLALEMVRHRNLPISSFVTDEGSCSSAAHGEGGDSTSRIWTRANSMPQPSFGGRSTSAPRRPPDHLDKTVHWIASGEVRVYIDPAEASTLAFFERHFCSDDHLVSGPAGTALRTRKIITVSLNGNQASASSPVGDLFGSDAGPPNALSSTSEFAVFGQLFDSLPTTPDASKRLTFSNDIGDRQPGASIPEGKVLSLVVGRKVVTMRKAPSVSAALGSQRARSSQGPASLNTVFSQAGLSLPQFGLEAAATGQRPDDPLPRGSIASLLQARALKRSKSGRIATGAITQEPVRPLSLSRSESPFVEPGLPSRPQSSGTGMGDAGPGEAPDEHGAFVAASSRSSLARRTSKPAGSNTPGRRGEKRPRRMLTIEETIEEEGASQPGRHTDLSPGKRRGPRVDRMQLEVPSLQSRLLAASRSKSCPSPADIKSEAVTPELPSLPLFGTSEDLSLLSARGVQQGRLSSSAAETASSSVAVGSMERSNRSMIKKLVYSILVSERGLGRHHEDFVACYSQAYSGTWCTFRRQGTEQRLDKVVVEKVVRLHLDLYLDGPAP